MQPRCSEHPKREVWETETLRGWVWRILGTERRDFLFCALGAATCPSHRGAAPPPPPAECSRDGWRTRFISHSLDGFHQNRGLPLPSTLKRMLTGVVIIKIRKSKKLCARIPSHLPCTPRSLAGSPAAFPPGQPQVARVTSHCSAPFAVPGVPSPHGIRLPFVARERAQSEGEKPKGRGGEPPAGPRTGGRTEEWKAQRGSGQEYSPALPAADPPSGPLGHRGARSCPLLCVRKTEPRLRAQQLRASLEAGTRLFFFFF